MGRLREGAAHATFIGLTVHDYVRLTMDVSGTLRHTMSYFQGMLCSLPHYPFNPVKTLSPTPPLYTCLDLVLKTFLLTGGKSLDT